MAELKPCDLEGKIINADCMDILKHLPDKCVDLVVTSPPYDNLRDYNGTLNWSFEIFQNIAKELARVIKDGGVIVWVVADATINGSETGTSFRQALYFKELGLNIHDTMIYAKHNPLPNAKTRYQQTFEYMFVFSKGFPKTTNILLEDRHNECNDKRTQRRKKFNRGKCGNFNKEHNYIIKDKVPRRNIWTYKIGLYNSTSYKPAFEHPAIYPERLAQDHILSWSNECDLILDPFSGSGTTAVACHRLKRKFICIEKDADYWDKSCERLKHEQVQMQLF